jgi:hypothetical protein
MPERIYYVLHFVLSYCCCNVAQSLTIIIMSTPYSIDEYDTINNQLMVIHHRCHPCYEYVKEVGDKVHVNDFVKSNIITFSPPPPGRREIPYAVHFRMLSSVGQILEYLVDEGGNKCCKENNYLKEDNVTVGVAISGVCAD